MTIDQKMAAGRVKSFRRDGSLMRSKSEGTLIDLDDSIFVSHNLNGKTLILRFNIQPFKNMEFLTYFQTICHLKVNYGQHRSPNGLF